MTGIPKSSSINLSSLGFNSKFLVFSSCHSITLVWITPLKWIIDTGATDHIICSLSLFTSITAKISTNVKLPNGKFVVVTHIETIQISANLILTNVLCVPSFSFNLFYVSKLIKSITCCFTLFAKFCFIQSLNSWMTIGLGELKDGLYYLVHDSAIYPSSKVTTKSASFPYFFASVKTVS